MVFSQRKEIVCKIFGPHSVRVIRPREVSALRAQSWMAISLSIPFEVAVINSRDQRRLGSTDPCSYAFVVKSTTAQMNVSANLK